MVREKGSFGRRIALPILIALFVLSGASLRPAAAQPGVDSPRLPENLTRESVRDLLSRLSDEQVRSLLIEQLDRAAAAPAPAKSAAGMGGMAAMGGMAGMVEENAGTIRGRVHAMYGALLAFPATLRTLAVRLGEGDIARLWPLLAHLAAMLAIGWIAHRAYDYALRSYRARLQTPAASFWARAFQLATGLLLDVTGLAVFALGALVVFFALWLDDELQRIAVLLALLAIVVVRVAALLVRFLLAPRADWVRLLPFADAPARTLRWFVIGFSVLYGAGIVATTLLAAAGADEATMNLLRTLFWTLGLVLALATAWRVRAPIASLIRGDRDHGTIVGWLADLWPVAATAYFVALFVGGVSDVLAGMPGPIGRGFASVLVVAALPIVDMALCRALAAAAAGDSTAAARPVVTIYEPIFRRAIHIVIIVAGLLLIAELWHLDLSAFAQRSLGGKIASSLLGISIVLLAAYMLWEIAKAAIDRRLAAEGEQQDDVPATRLRTLLPILRATILVTIFVMAAMSILAALGVDILPLLAGASIVGVAIGFGSQTLVRDIVSGAFFLMDDAFRLGEYIEVGDAKGRVEKINLRSVFLRHHRGALNVLPYGEIKRLRNTSRDWSIHVMEFRLTYDTNMLQVKKIMKQIGEELAADPDYAGDLLQPLKSAGVMSAEDSAIVVRAKFTARPTNNAWVIRRVAYDRVIRAFRAAGIRFAHRQVTVNVPSSHDDAAAAATSAGGAAAALDSPRAIDKASQS
jgi:small-conductance mechanosensitive channel